jgi:hypothetical protein
MNAAWAAVVLAAVTVGANVFAVVWSSRTQRLITRSQRIGDRQTDTYVDLLKWVADIEAVGTDFQVPQVVEAMKLPGDLGVRAVAFASGRVMMYVSAFQFAWAGLNDRISHARPEIVSAFGAGFRANDVSAVIAVAPEYEPMMEAKEGIRYAIREELLGELRPRTWRGVMG